LPTRCGGGVGLPDVPGRPLIGIVSRLASQKGFDLLAPIAGDLAQENMAMAVLGSGEKWFEDMFRGFAQRWPDRYAVRIGYDNGLAHRIEAGADMILMPSRYEPCGLNQIYSLRYGTVPMVYATGGLEDTVDEKTGFKFHEHTPAALAAVVRESLRAWQTPFPNNERWIARMKAGMRKDFSWNQSAAKYEDVYAQLLGGAAKAA
jgi:starch synthase